MLMSSSVPSIHRLVPSASCASPFSILPQARSRVFLMLVSALVSAIGALVAPPDPFVLFGSLVSAVGALVLVAGPLTCSWTLVIVILLCYGPIVVSLVQCG